MHTFRENLRNLCLTAFQMGCFYRRVAVDFQHPLKAVYRFLRRCDLHLPAGGEYPAVEIDAEINGCLHAEMALVHDLRRNVLYEARGC